MASINPLLEWAQRKQLEPAQVDTLALQLGLLPDSVRWRQWLDRVLLVLGVLLLAAALVFFIAANWSALGRFTRFGLAQACLLAGVGVYLRRGDDLAGRCGLAFSVLVIGALFALYGQTYQTGADPWQLFAAWALCALPLVWLASAAPLALFWLVLVDVALLRWLDLHIEWWPGLGDIAWPVWTLFLLHGAAWVLAELAWTGTPRYARLLLYLATLAPVATLAFFAILGVSDETPAALVAWLGVAAATWWWYRGRSFDVLPLAALALSAIVLVTTAVGRAFDDFDNPLVWLLLAGLSIAMTMVAGSWLFKQVRQQRSVVAP